VPAAGSAREYGSWFVQAIIRNGIEEFTVREEVIVGARAFQDIAARKTVGGHHHSLERAVLANGLKTKGGTGGKKAAPWSLGGGNVAAIHGDCPHYQQFERGRIRIVISMMIMDCDDRRAFHGGI
jgi:hypothetical protein